MISQKALKSLVAQKLKDADVLAANRRYAAAVYIVGYALELALKLKICKLLNFTQGFPEDRIEFMTYQTGLNNQALLASAITQVRDIRNHNLPRLLFYSGAEYHVKLHMLNEWNMVAAWDPEIRYKVQKVLKQDALGTISAVKSLTHALR
jgi:hypothetical protein